MRLSIASCFTQSPKMPAPIAPAAPNSNLRATAPVALGAAFVVCVKTGVPVLPGSEALLAPVGSEALVNALDAALRSVEADSAAEPPGLLF